MTSIVERYDRDAEDYERYWAPVLDRAARDLLDRVEAFVAGIGDAPAVLDVGTGSGVLAIEALDRWPGARVIGTDPSTGMLGMARQRVTRLGADDGRAAWLEAPADVLPLPDGAVDLVVSSFALQLVPDRAAALREAYRVLRPGGRLAFVTWLDRGEAFAPSVEFDESVLDLGVEEPDWPDEEVRSGDFGSVRAAADETRRAGFRRVAAREVTLAFDWDLASYLEFKIRYDEVALFQWLPDEDAHRLVDIAHRRLAALSADAFRWRTPIVSVVAERPA
ncbi:MAG: methyltransferase domain-containing protein [Candidatus Limnocylindrales bacterium]